MWFYVKAQLNRESDSASETMFSICDADDAHIYPLKLQGPKLKSRG